VVLYGVEAYVELFGDLGVGATLEDESEDLFLFGRQPDLTGALPETPRASSSFLAGTRTQLVFDDLRSYLLQLPLEVFDLIPQLRRVLKLELLGGSKHLGLEIGDEVL
jgi:hypothetical protein